MQVATYRIPAKNRSSRRSFEAFPDAKHISFGDEVLLYTAASKWTETQQRAERAGIQLEPHKKSVTRERLHLVTQIGDMFRKKHPGVPVILNKGRYLAIELDPERARRLGAENPACYNIRPIEAIQVAFDIRVPIAKRAAAPEWIKALVSRVSRARLEANLQHLVSYPTRHSTSSHYVDAAAWAADQLRFLGYRTRTEQIRVGAAGRSLNIVAEKSGVASGPRQVFLVVAHLDSINWAEGSSASAPGADDNGSGSAGLLEIATVLANHPALHDLRFILFGGEEQGLFGSRQYVERLLTGERQRIRAAINMDMIASLNTSTPTVLLEGATVSEHTIEGLVEAAGAFTQLGIQTSLNAANSDHVPFIEAGIPAVLTIEGTDSANGRVHTAADSIQHLSYDLMLDVLRMNVAFAARTLEVQGGSSMKGHPEADDGEIVIRIKDRGNLAEALRSLPFQYSGRYLCNGGASVLEGRGFLDPRSGVTKTALENPIYKLEQPVYVETLNNSRGDDQLHFTLHVDIDGPEPLHVVSGTVGFGAPLPGQSMPHFIGRVVSNTLSGNSRSLVVKNFGFQWPENGDRINQVEISLTGTILTKPVAEVKFSDASGQRSYGPFMAEQVSTYFREVDMDVDHEDDAVAVEPCNSHVHPDRPSDLAQEEMTLESTFAKAGILINRSAGSGTVIDSSWAGVDKKWDEMELHDSMQLHWDAFANKPQWKMWIFLAERATDDQLGGVMFDGDIDEPGGVDRQGTAIFTRCPYFHSQEGGYIKANPPKEEAIKRELFFNLIHETGHAFNLAHSFQKQLVGGPGEIPWTPPAWMPLSSNPQALSWMNYPDAATPGAGAGANASWFYQRFGFRFDESELLFLRHAAESYVQMGNAQWFYNHGRVARISVDRRLKLELRSRKPILELGEPVMIELKLSNVGSDPVWVHGNLDPSDGLVEVAVTNPRGKRVPFLPLDHTRSVLKQRQLQNREALYESLDVTMGKFGFAFKEPGAYRLEACYLNLDGGTAAAVFQLYVRPPLHYDDNRTVNELFNARVGRTLYVEGTRVMEDVNDRLDWIRGRLGSSNPISQHLTTVRFKPLAKPGKIIAPLSNRVKIADQDPERVVAELKSVVTDNATTSSDTMGHIWYRQVVDTYTQAALDAGQPQTARKAQENLLDFCKAREIVPSVVQQVENRLRQL
jgi:hypothetical protein